MDPVTKNLKALQGALEHSLTIQRARVQEIVDDLVSRGTLSRTDADGLLGQLLASSKDYSQALLQVLDSITSETRKTIGAGIAPVMATAGKIADTVLKKPAKNPVQAPKAAPAAPADPLPGLSDMTVAEIKPRLTALNASALRRVRERELAGKARKTVLGQIDHLLGARS
jgi:hypothetical protein